MSKDDFTKNRFRWLEQVAGDPKLPAAAKSIAIMLCTKYFSRVRNGDAWPSVESLALDTKTCERTARAALRALAKYQHMTIHEGGGRHRTNHYDMLINPAADCTVSKSETRQPTAPFVGAQRNANVIQSVTQEGETRQSSVRNPAMFCRKPGNVLPPNPLNNPLREPFEKTVQQPGLAAANTKGKIVRLKDPDAFIERLYREVPDEVADMVAQFGQEERFEAAALRAYNKVRFDEETFFARLQTLNVQEHSLTEIFSFLNGEHIKLLPKTDATFAKLYAAYPAKGSQAEANDAQAVFDQLMTEFPDYDLNAAIKHVKQNKSSFSAPLSKALAETLNQQRASRGREHAKAS